MAITICAEKRHKWDFANGPVVKTLPSNSGGAGSILDWGAKIPHASWPKKKESIKQKQFCKKFNKVFKEKKKKEVRIRTRSRYEGSSDRDADLAPKNRKEEE